MEEVSAIILAPGISFADWESDLQAALIEKGRLAHVFHNLDEIKPATRLTEPTKPDDMNKNYEALAKCRESEIEAKNVLLRRLSPSVRPQNFRHMSAKENFDNIAPTREESAAIRYEASVRNPWNIKFITIDDYCDKFMQYYLSVNSAAESLVPRNPSDSVNPYLVLQGYARCIFVLGTEEIDWLDTWRQTKVHDSKNRFYPLEKLISTPRQVGGPRIQSSGQVNAAKGAEENDLKEERVAFGGPEDACILCRHRHRNKDCFRQHPELKRSQKIKGKGKVRSRASVATEENYGTSDDEEGIPVSRLARAASASLNKNPLLYDTGASHHFIRCEKDFVQLNKLHKPFQFDQAVGISKLTHKGTSRITIGNRTLGLEESLLSPDSTCTIISAGRLNEHHGLSQPHQISYLYK